MMAPRLFQNMEKTPFLTTFTATSRQAPSLLIAFCVLTFGSFTALAQGNLKRPISTDKAPKPLTGVYSQGIEARGTMVFCAGQIGQTLEGTFAGDDVVSQLRQAFANIQAVLASANCSLDHVVKITIYLKNMDDFYRYERSLHCCIQTSWRNDAASPHDRRSSKASTRCKN